MTSIVSRGDVQACGKAESNAADERIHEADAREIDVGVPLEKRPHLIVGREELPNRIVQWR